MRHTVVHRGRRTVAWSSTAGPAGLTGFPVPAFPELTDIEAAVTAGGYDAASFAAPAADLPEELSKTVGAFVSDACGVLSELWRKRRAAPGLLPQSPKQWKQAGELIKPVPVFRGFPNPPGAIAWPGHKPGHGDRSRAPPQSCWPDSARRVPNSGRTPKPGVRPRLEHRYQAPKTTIRYAR